MPARPAFLDQPPRELPGSGRPGALQRNDASAELPVPPMLPSDAGAGSATATDGGDVAGESHSMSPSRTQLPNASAPSARYQAYQTALVSTVLVSDHGVGGDGPQKSSVGGGASASIDGPYGRPTSDTLAGDSEREPDTRTPAMSGATKTAVLPSSTAKSPALVAASTALRPSTPSTVTTALPPGSAYVVRAGTVIPGLLLTGINSDLAGEILGQISRDVFDSRTEQVLLIPKGSRLIGSYDNRSASTGRLIVEWTRMILPDGRSLALPHLAATDEQGQAGLHDNVNHHYGRIYGAALLTSVISAGVQLSQPQQSALYATPSSRQVAAGALGQNLGDVALESAKRGLDTPPTITIRPGHPFDVFLSGDLAFDGPYVAAPL